MGIGEVIRLKFGCPQWGGGNLNLDGCEPRSEGQKNWSYLTSLMDDP